jgi:hypothetical protein
MVDGDFAVGDAEQQEDAQAGQARAMDHVSSGKEGGYSVGLHGSLCLLQ